MVTQGHTSAVSTIRCIFIRWKCSEITFDLDPDEGLDFADVIAAAKVVKAKLDGLGLTSFVKTTGGKGLHVVVPIKTDARSRVTWDQAKAFAKAVSELIRRASAPPKGLKKKGQLWVFPMTPGATKVTAKQIKDMIDALD